MFCRNCGASMQENDYFCGNCGTSVGENKTIKGGKIQYKNSFENFFIIRLLKTYFKNPLSFFTKLKDEELVKESLTLIIALPIISGLLTILYNSALLNSLFSTIKNIPDFLLKIGIIKADEAIKAKNELIMSDEFINLKSKTIAMIDNKEIFLSGFVQVLIIMLLTGIILAILNSVILKNKIDIKKVLFLSTSSYIPLILVFPLVALSTLISIPFGIFIYIFGYILSFITLYSGIKQFSDEKNDKVFILMAILFIAFSAVLSIIIVKELESSIMSVTKILKMFDEFM